MNKSLSEIEEELDKWVEYLSAGGYVPAQWELPDRLDLSETFAIQQNREEILEFTNALLSTEKLSCILEIGLGFFGSTHFLWRQIFESVTTIEKDHKRVRAFGDRLRNFSGGWILDDKKSKFIYGYSYEPSVVESAYSLGKIDALFIDGDHQYKSVLTDYLLYEPLVKSGGIIAFHDTVNSNYENNVPKLIDQIKLGQFGAIQDIKSIVHSKNLGISYYIKL